MPRFSNLELSPSDSQKVLGSLDPVSFLSEPPDIRNWFSSYVYESPELNTLDGFQVSDGCTETSLGENVKTKLGKNVNVLRRQREDDLVAGVEGSLDGIVKCNGSDEFEHNKPPAVVSAFSDSFSQCSEPPDIKNWFSSYLYESPPLDTLDNFSIFSYKGREDGSLTNSQKTCKESDKDVKNFSDLEHDTVLPNENNISAMVLKCTNLVEDAEQENQSICKDGYNAELKPIFSTPSQLTSQSISGQTLLEQITHNQNHASVERLGNTNTQENSCLCAAKSNGKENEEAKLPENGFIRTRKNSRNTNNGNPQLYGVQSEVQRNGIKPASNNVKDKLSRKVLSETTNFHSSNAPEVTGKWRCPQKYKPKLGPPLKQLRLEQWVRRV